MTGLAFDSQDSLSGGVFDPEFGNTYTPLLSDETDDIAGWGADLHLLQEAGTPTGIATQGSV